MEITLPKIKLTVSDIETLKAFDSKIRFTYTQKSLEQLLYLGLITREEKPLDPVKESKRKIDYINLLIQVKEAVKKEDWDLASSLIYNIRSIAKPPEKTWQYVVTTKGKTLLEKGSVSIDLKDFKISS